MAMKIKRIISGRIILLLSLVILFSCEEHGLFVICNECDDNEPLSAELEIRMDESNETLVLINVYEGNLEDNNLVHSIQSFSSTIYYTAKINRKYTITATYTKPAGTFIAVDSALPRVKYSKESCDNPCYWVYDRIINLELKNIN